MDDNEQAAAAARDPAALAAAPEDRHLAGAPLHDDTLGTTAAVGLNVPALAATARAQRLDERNAAAEAARQHDELQRYRRDMAAPVRTDPPRLRADLNRGGGRGAFLFFLKFFLVCFSFLVCMFCWSKFLIIPNSQGPEALN